MIIFIIINISFYYLLNIGVSVLLPKNFNISLAQVKLL